MTGEFIDAFLTSSYISNENTKIVQSVLRCGSGGETSSLCVASCACLTAELFLPRTPDQNRRRAVCPAHATKTRHTHTGLPTLSHQRHTSIEVSREGDQCDT